MVTMNEFILENEAMIRLSVFFGVFFVMALWEVFLPKRELVLSKAKRWISNIGIVFLNTALVRVVFPVVAVGIALFAEKMGWGVFNYFDLPFYLVIFLSIIFLDLTIYLQHVMFHAVPVLWNVHRMHHADMDIDVTTGARFHPIEIILSMLIKFSAIIILGAPVLAVVLFEVILNAMAMFNHSNVRMFKGLDSFLRIFVVTPDMHRIHHSIKEDETNSNFGFNLSLWDRIFGTYKAQPDDGHLKMKIGITTFDDPKICSRLDKMLLIPFLKKDENYSINRRKFNDLQ